MSAKLAIRWVLIKVDGEITVRHIFKNSLTVACQRDSELFIDALSLVLGKRSLLNRYPYDITILSGIELDGESYHLRAKKKNNDKVRITVNKKGERENIETEYFSLIEHNKEEERLSTFKEFNYTHRVGKYLENRLKIDTGGYINTRSFRQFLNKYISSFEKIRLHPMKDYYLTLDKNGEFKAITGNGDDAYLSETENVLYNFYCFMCLNELWCEAEKIRNFNHIVKPIIVSGLLERLDMGVDTSLCVEKMRNLPCQVILIVENERELGRI